MKDVTILIAGSGNITGLNVIRALNGHVQLVGFDCNDVNPSDMFCKNHRVPKAVDPTYKEAILKLVMRYRPRAIIASNDHDVRALHQFRLELKSLGTDLNADDNTLTYLDKLATSKRFTEFNVTTPKIIADGLNCPPYVMRKSSVGSGQKFTYIIKSAVDRHKLPGKPIIFPDDVIITEYVEGKEYTVDVLSDLTSNVLAVVPRLRHEVRAGIVHFGEIVKNETVINQTKSLAQKLSLTGMNCVQCIVSDVDQQCYFFEVNPRPGSGLDLTTHAGVNMPLAWLDTIDGKTPIVLEPEWGLKMVRYHDGYFFR